jgi:hypothetical protein
LLHLEASQAMVFQSGLKTGGGAVRMVQVASSQRSSADEAEDRCAVSDPSISTLPFSMY